MSVQPLTSLKLAKDLDRAFAARTRHDLLQMVTDTLHNGVPHYSWVGFYLVERNELVLHAWTGPAATEHTRISLGTGVCGAAASSGRTEVVPDVSKDPRYLMCFANTKSELVVPIHRDGKVIGEIDIDSDKLNAFSEEDRIFLEKLAQRLSEIF